MAYIQIDDLIPRGEESWEYDAPLVSHFRQSGSNPPVCTLQDYVLQREQKKQYSGNDLPHFHQRQRTGELLPHTPFQVIESDYSAKAFRDYHSSSLRYFTEAPGLWWNDASLTVSDIEPYIPDRYDQYVQEAAAGIYEEGFDALTFLVELKDITKLYVSICKKINALKRLGRYRKNISIKKLLQAYSSDWLEVRYGVRPIIYDIIGITELIENWNNRRTRHSNRSGRKWLESNEVISHVDGSNYVKHQKRVYDKIELSIRGSVTADIEVPRLIFNPVVTAWELVPLSFVIDWLINVGNTLSAISFLGRAKNYTASASFYIKISRHIDYTVEWMKTGWSGDWWQSSISTAVYKVRRPCRVPYFPHIIAKINPFKVLDSIGLILQRI